MPLVRVHSLCWVKKWKHIADRAINENRLHLRNRLRSRAEACVWLGVRPDSQDMEAWETEDLGIVLDKFFLSCRRAVMSSESRTYKHTYILSHFIQRTWSATINTAGFPNAGNADWRQCFPGLTHFSEAHWHWQYIHGTSKSFGYRRLLSVRGVVNLLCDSNDSGGESHSESDSLMNKQLYL